eukprot:FR734478.1.p3 GENE.FR734478.1~~FR734478.1.p3  ORF type:complete len:111 (-),score=54.70 FR734478.1:833-1165(-)
MPPLIFRAPPPGFSPFLGFPGLFCLGGNWGGGKTIFTPGNQFWPLIRPKAGNLTPHKRKQNWEFPPRGGAPLELVDPLGSGPWAVTPLGPLFFFFFFLRFMRYIKRKTEV